MEGLIKLPRIEFLDGARGIAVIVMIIYHLLWDIRTFWPRPVLQLSITWWLWGGGIIGGAFLFIAGLSASLTVLSHSRKKILMGGLKTFGWALLLSGVSFVVMPQSPIYFGILHCIGVGLMMAAYLASRPHVTCLAVVVSLMIGVITEYIPGHGPWTTWIGMKYAGFESADYFPLFPWGGVLFMGLLFGPSLNENREKFVSAPPWLLFLGRHSLIIYLLHQPCLVGMVNALGRLT